MNKFVFVIPLIFLSLGFYAQKSQGKTLLLGAEEYCQLKENGGLKDSKMKGINPLVPSQQTTYKNKNASAFASKKKASSCYNYFAPRVGPQDSVPDDGFIIVNLPFSFCFYGNSYDSLWVNDNGTVSFDSRCNQLAVAEVSVTGFPYTSPGTEAEEIIAPFWADFDQSDPQSGRIYIEMLSNAMIVHWNTIPYYNGTNPFDGKTNTMMLILSDGTSSLLQAGSNVGFFYGDMQWTTGNASFGGGGFGGDPAIVGVNRGDNISFIDFGYFDSPGSFYDGPGGLNDGVDWLDNKTFMFSTCGPTNSPPIVSGIDLCDTVKICVGDTLPLNVVFLAPEPTQITTASVDTSLASGLYISNIVSGSASTAQIDALFVATMSNIGSNSLHFKASDNAIPSDSIAFDYIIVVDTLPFLPEITGDTVYCEGANVTLDAGFGFDTYLWSNDSTTQVITVTQGIYSVEAAIGGCSFTTSQQVVTEYSEPSLQIIGDSLYCNGDSSLLRATSGFDNYLWSTTINDTLDSIYVFEGSYSVTVTDTNNCLWTSDTFNVVNFSNLLNITGDTSYCIGETVTLFATPGLENYQWNLNVTDSLDSLVVTQGNYFVTASSNGCLDTAFATVNLINVPIPSITGDASYCIGQSSILNGDGDNVGYDFGSFLWDTPTPSSAQVVNVQEGTYTVSVTLHGCPATSAPFVVVEQPLPEPVILGDLHFCSNDSSGTTVYTAESYSSYEWSNGDTNSSTFVSSSISVLVTDTFGCKENTTAIITSSAPDNNITGDQAFCPGKTIIISADAGFASYFWYNTGENTQEIEAGAGTHYVTVSDGFCEDTDTITLSPEPGPTATFTTSPNDYQRPNLPVVFTNTSTANSNNTIDDWSWDFDWLNIGSASPQFSSSSGSPSVSFAEQGTYNISLTVTANNGCADTLIQEYLIVDKIEGSNIITPNGDRYNQYLKFKNIQFYNNNKLTVYTRWGNPIFEQENYQNDWNGGGHNVGTYYYVLTVDGIADPIKGYFTILD